MWGLRSLIRAMGGYFVRRDSSNPLYRKVLARYVHMATASGVAQAVFPEGGLTRDGALRPPKLGILSYIVAGFDPQGPRDIVFVPVGLNYDRVLEDRVQVAAAATPQGERPRFAFNPLMLAGWLLRSLWLRLRGRWHRYGYACVSFGRPMSLREYLRDRALDLRALASEQRFAEIERLGRRLMQEVGRVVPALPVSLVATAILDAGERGLSAFELKGAVFELIRRLGAAGAHVHIPRHDQEYAVEVGLRMLMLRHLVDDREGIYRANPAEHALLAYYANAIAHLLVKPAQSYGFGLESRSGKARTPIAAWRQPGQVGADEIVDQTASRLRRHHRELVGGRERGDAVHAGPKHARGTLQVRLLAWSEMGSQGALDVAHQSLQLLLIPSRQIRSRRHVVLEQQVPEAGLFPRECQVGMRNLGHAPIGAAIRSLNVRQALVQGVQHPSLDVQHHVVEIGEHIVDGARRVADAARDFSGREAGQALRVYDLLRRIEDQLAQLLRGMRRPSAHGVPRALALVCIERLPA